MVVRYPAKPSFVAGRLSPRLFGRTDLDQYRSGLEEARNFIVFPHGGATRRSGSYFVQEIKDSNVTARVVPFVFSNDQAYMIELGVTGGAGYARVFLAHAPLLDGGGDQIELVLPYTSSSDVDALRFTQSGDILYLVNRNYRPQLIRRTGALSWSVVSFGAGSTTIDGPYDPAPPAGSASLTPSAVSGSITITASSGAGINNGSGFLSTDIGRLVRLFIGGVWGWAEITAVSDPTTVTASVRGEDLGGTTATTSWRLGAWSDTTGWPEAVTFHQQRLFFARGQNVWGSVTGDFDSFAPTSRDGDVADDNGVSYRLAAGKIDLIQWLQSGRVLEVGTAGAEFTVSGGSTVSIDTPLSPDTVLARKTSEIGSFSVGQPIFTDRGTVFIDRSGREVINYYYAFDQDSYGGDNLTLLAEDLPYPYVFELAYEAKPDRLIRAVRADGALLTCTFNPSQSVVAWTELVLGGEHDDGPAVVESAAAIPEPGGLFDETWLVVLRTINGETKRYIEYLKPSFGPLDDIRDAFFVDCGLTYDGPPETNFTGLEHLEGEEVVILADGAIVPSQVVEDGEVTLPEPASVVHIGLPYDATLRLLPFEIGDLGDTGLARRGRVAEIGVLFYRTVLGRAGLEGQPLETFGVRTTNDPLGEPLEPRTDFLMLPVQGESEYRPRIVIEQNLPLPCTVLSVTPKLDYP